MFAAAALLAWSDADAQRLQDGNYRTIGHADSGIRREWVAWFYFFMK